MAIFAYQATDLGGGATSGTVAADSPRQARDLLRERGLAVSRMAPLEERAAGRLARRRVARRHQAEVVSFARELATLLSAGISLLSALHTLALQHGRQLRTAIQHLAERIAAGERLADFREKALRLRSRVAAALAYPAFVCVMGVGVSLFLMTYVVPKLLATLLEAGKPLPGITLAVKAASDFVVDWWWAALGGLVAVAVAARAALSTERGRLLADRLVLRIPLVGALVRKEATSRIAVVLAALLRSGLQFVDAVRITRGTLRNRLFRRALEDYERAVSAGSDVAAPLAASGAFSPMVVQMLAVGQEAGQLEDMLEEVAATYDQEVASATGRLTAMLEPLLIVVLAVIVGFIALATVLPILEVNNVL